jgi:hypothetical protein
MGKALFSVNTSTSGQVRTVTVYSPELSEPVILPNQDLNFPSTAINRARNEYTTFLANRQYQSIPTDLNQIPTKGTSNQHEPIDTPTNNDGWNPGNHECIHTIHPEYFIDIEQSNFREKDRGYLIRKE